MSEDCLPDCMMPDGGQCCAGYTKQLQRIEVLENSLREAGDIYREATSLARARIEALEADVIRFVGQRDKALEFISANARRIEALEADHVNKEVCDSYALENQRFHDRIEALEAALRERDQLDRYVPDIVKNAMLTMWNYICDDTKCHPLDIEHGKSKYVTFTPNHWAQFTGEMVQKNLRDLYTSDARAALAPEQDK